ncbi:hypothetical protein BC833DRAFT_655852 [Globomyces pollinis-pini]|nr:hypothetical protein BC833DRAFT_655852 [Globomyces pollinis-pini]
MSCICYCCNGINCSERYVGQFGSLSNTSCIPTGCITNFPHVCSMDEKQTNIVKPYYTGIISNAVPIKYAEHTKIIALVVLIVTFTSCAFFIYYWRSAKSRHPVTERPGDLNPHTHMRELGDQEIITTHSLESPGMDSPHISVVNIEKQSV